jgi:hypothetical protein
MIIVIMLIIMMGMITMMMIEISVTKGTIWVEIVAMTVIDAKIMIIMIPDTLMTLFFDFNYP